MDTYTSKYECTLDTLKTTIEKYGVAVLPSVFSQKECDSITNGVWNYLEYASSKWKTPISRKKKKTWNLTNFSPLHNMLIQHHKIGYMQEICNVRQDPRTIEAFSTLWDTTDLISSIDGASICFPPEVTKKGWHKNLWLHTDLSYNYDSNKDNRDCIQSWLTSVPVKRGDATLVFLEKSHKFHKKFSKRYTKKYKGDKKLDLTNKKDWYKLNDDQLDIYMNKYKCKLKRIKCPAGSFVFWKSATIHCGQNPFRERKHPNMRICFYICLMPRDRATDKQLSKKREVFEDMRLTSHNPIKSNLFPANPRFYSQEQKDKVEKVLTPPSPKLNKVGMMLMGYDPTESSTESSEYTLIESSDGS